MSYGYSQSLVLANKTASARSLGVALGRLCIAKGISVKAISNTFGVSRMTIYNWFKGEVNPRPSLALKVQRYIDAQSKK